ncbi:MAG: amiloride-sensitive sodium channel family protein [Chlorobi bacterium]|nr:amiloride-sensitive sodium channel family protein [Chlorobiota bacterium]
MKQKDNSILRTLWWLLPLVVVVSFGASLFAVWLLSKLFEFSFDSTTAVIISMLTAASSSTGLSAIILTQRKH